MQITDDLMWLAERFATRSVFLFEMLAVLVFTNTLQKFRPQAKHIDPVKQLDYLIFLVWLNKEK